jgi:hypothetical protein
VAGSRWPVAGGEMRGLEGVFGREAACGLEQFCGLREEGQA